MILHLKFDLKFIKNSLEIDSPQCVFTGSLKLPHTLVYHLRLKTIQQFARAEGFSAAVAAQVGLARRLSLRTNYQLKWSVYRDWCRKESHSISRPSLPKVADFLFRLCRSKGLSVSSILGYRSMLAAVFRTATSSISSDPVLQDLIQSFKVEAPPRPVRPPAWDLSPGVALPYLSSL